MKDISSPVHADGLAQLAWSRVLLVFGDVVVIWTTHSPAERGGESVAPASVVDADDSCAFDSIGAAPCWT